MAWRSSAKHIHTHTHTTRHALLVLFIILFLSAHKPKLIFKSRKTKTRSVFDRLGGPQILALNNTVTHAAKTQKNILRTPT